jgi:hypothetical protein
LLFCTLCDRQIAKRQRYHGCYQQRRRHSPVVLLVHGRDDITAVVRVRIREPTQIHCEALKSQVLFGHPLNRIGHRSR